MADGLAQAYHWPLPEIMKLTLPQIILMNHGAHVNNERSDERIEHKRKDEQNNPEIDGANKRLSEMSDDEKFAYYERVERAF